MSSHRIQQVIEDVEWLVDAGEHPSRIEARVGYGHESLLTLLRRAGRLDLHAKLKMPGTEGAA